MTGSPQQVSCRKHPDWLKAKIPAGEEYYRVKGLLEKLQLHTVCRYANCPNIGECYGRGTATFLILGNTCTRDCGYCRIDHGKPGIPDPAEPAHIAEAAGVLGLRYVVITSVTRDDLPDGGAAHFAQVVKQIHSLSRDIRVELLIPDFRGSRESLQIVTAAAPAVIGHNLETVSRLFPIVRPEGNYRLSLTLLRNIKNLAPGITVKSGIMLGMGENEGDILEALQDLRNHQVDIVIVGQYLCPGPGHLPLEKYYTPQEFEKYRTIALEMGFKAVAAAPLVRSSYRAGELYNGYTYHP